MALNLNIYHMNQYQRALVQQQYTFFLSFFLSFNNNKKKLPYVINQTQVDLTSSNSRQGVHPFLSMQSISFAIESSERGGRQESVSNFLLLMGFHVCFKLQNYITNQSILEKKRKRPTWEYQCIYKHAIIIYGYCIRLLNLHAVNFRTIGDSLLFPFNGISSTGPKI